MQKMRSNGKGFTIIELIVVIVIISILTAITAVIYNGIQARSRLTKVESDITAVQRSVEAYKARNGTYPVTAASLNPDWATATARTDANCSFGTHTADWVPSLSTTLPQSSPTSRGVNGFPGCYLYASDGTSYVLSGWNMLDSPQTDTMYRRLGFRETDVSHSSQEFYICNHTAIGGASGTYNINIDYYKRSYTVSNITSALCNETPPTGA